VRDGLGGGTTGQMTQTNQRDVLCCVTPCLATRGKRRFLRGAVSCLLLGNWLGVGLSSRCVPCFVFFSLLLLVLRLLSNDFCYLNPQVLSLLFFLSSFPIQLWEREWSSSRVLLRCPPGLTPNTAPSQGCTQTLSPPSCPSRMGWW